MGGQLAVADQARSALPSHFAAVDVLRGIAALAVLLFHYVHFYYPFGVFEVSETERHLAISQMPLQQFLSPLYLYGGSAVQVFWCISGFVFAHVYAGHSSSGAEFALRRFARLYPLHFLTLIVVAALQLVAMLYLGSYLIYRHNDATNFILHLFMASAWGLGSAYSFNGPIWSVSVELIIYAVFWVVSSKLPRYGVVGPLAIASVMLGLIAMDLPQSMFWLCGLYFFLGSSLYQLIQAARRPFLAAILSSLLTFVAGCAIYLFYRSELVFVLPFLAVAVVAAAVSADLSRLAPWFGRMRFIGDSTYGTYLWHVPVQLVLLIAMYSGLIDREIKGSVLFLGFFLLSTLCAGIFSYHYVEKPANRFILLFARQRRGHAIAS